MTTLRQLQLHDAETAAALERLCLPQPWSAADYRHWLSHSDAVAYCGVAQQQITAVVMGLALAPQAELWRLMVHPDWRRRGMARQLALAFAAAAQKRHCSAIVVDVAADNIEAQKLYFSLQFHEITRRLQYYPSQTAPGHQVDALILTKTLPIITQHNI